MISTRAQLRQQQVAEEREAQRERESGCVPNLWDEFAMLDGDVIEPTRTSRPRMTRSQRRQHCRERVNSPPVHQEIRELQAQDKELQRLVEQDGSCRPMECGLECIADVIAWR